jgi:hypothetical protein
LYPGEHHTVTVGRDVDDTYRGEERSGPAPVNGEGANDMRIIVVDAADERPAPVA